MQLRLMDVGTTLIICYFGNNRKKFETAGWTADMPLTELMLDLKKTYLASFDVKINWNEEYIIHLS